jgi:hypothetical protein
MTDKPTHSSADAVRLEAAKALQAALDRRDSTTPPESRTASR